MRAALRRPPTVRTVPSRRIIAGRMSLGEVKREVLEAFRLGRQIERQRHERDPGEEYERGFSDALQMVDEDDARAVSRPQPIDLGGLGYSEYWAVYAAVLEDLGGPAPDEPDYGWSDE